jgi:hypothetical protein
MRPFERRGERDGLVIDNFALGLTHALMLLAAWRLLSRPDLDDDDAPRAPAKSWFPGRKRADDA